MKKIIAVLPGDGIGPEVMKQALRVLDAIAKKYSHSFIYNEAKIGGAAFDSYQTHCPDETISICENADAILFGSVGGPVDQQHLSKWKNCEAQSILKLRKHFHFNINMRPVIVHPMLRSISPLKDEIIGKGIDILLLRELIGDIYFGKHYTTTNDSGKRVAYDEAVYNEDQIASIAHVAFQAARQRREHVTSVDKANVLDTSKLWRTVMSEVGEQYPDVTLKHMLIDNCAMQLVIDPKQFDVIVTSNMFGDILSDTAAGIPGSLGLMPSASLNAENFGLYEPAGGSAQEIAGKNIANPIAQILSASMMLRYSFGMNEEADDIQTAISEALQSGIRTRDIASQNHSITTSKFTNSVIQQICDSI